MRASVTQGYCVAPEAAGSGESRAHSSSEPEDPGRHGVPLHPRLTWDGPGGRPARRSAVRPGATSSCSRASCGAGGRRKLKACQGGPPPPVPGPPPPRSAHPRAARSALIPEFIPGSCFRPLRFRAPRYGAGLAQEARAKRRARSSPAPVIRLSPRAAPGRVACAGELPHGGRPPPHSLRQPPERSGGPVSAPGRPSAGRSRWRGPAPLPVTAPDPRSAIANLPRRL